MISYAKNPIMRICTEINLLNYNNKEELSYNSNLSEGYTDIFAESYSINNLSELLQVKPAIIIQDLAYILSSGEYFIEYICSLTNEIMSISSDKKIIKEIENDIKKIDINTSIILHLYNDSNGATPKFLLYLSNHQLYFLNRLADYKITAKNKRYSFCYIKESYTNKDISDYDKRKKLRISIDNKKIIKLLYQTSNDIQEIETIPLKLIEYNYDDECYLLARKSNDSDLNKYAIYNVCKIKKFEELPNSSCKINSLTDEETQEINRINKHIFGMELTDEPINIKIRIENQNNIVEKVKRDLSSHTDGIYTDKGDYVYFEDYIIGSNKFRSWVRSYGSSIIILEPEYLAIEMIKSAKKVIDLYKL